MRICLGLIILGMIGGNTMALDLYVSKEGNDDWSGKLPEPNAERTDGPFATLERARDEIRRYKKERKNQWVVLDRPFTVHVRGGTYQLAHAFELGVHDSGAAQSAITYRAYDGERVRLTGGRRVTGFEPVTEEAVLQRLDPAAREHVLQADLKAQGITDFGEMRRRGFGVGAKPAGLELFFKDEPMTLARWPNEGYVRIADVPAGNGGRFMYEGDRPERWKEADDIWLHGFWTWDWADSYEKVATIQSASKEIETVPPHGVYGYKKGGRYYALNLLEELDQPGEWYLDRDTGILHFWPPSPIEEGEVWVSVLDSLISMDGVHHVTVRGFLLDMGRGTAVTMKDGSFSQIAGCTIRSIGNKGVVVNGGINNTVVGCDIYNLGDGGISVSGGHRKTLKPGGHVILNNHIHHFSRWSICYTPAVSVSGVELRVAHNLIHDAPHMGIGLHGNEHVIEFNEFHHLCMDTDDAGAIYMGRDYTQLGNVIRDNYFHDIGEYSGRVGVQSIYLDDFTSGVWVYGNVCYRGGRGILIGGGRSNTVQNNIFVDCRPAIHVDSRGIGWAKNYFSGEVTTLTDRMEAMNYREPPYSTRYPELLTLYEDEPALAKYNVIARNISVGEWFLNLLDGLTTDVVRVEDNLIYPPQESIEEYQDAYGERNLVGKDPKFVDGEGRNFRLQDDSPAFKLGFQQVPFERMGLYQDEFREALALH